MALILCLETATHSCSVALSANGKVVASRHDHSSGYSHAEKLHVFAEEVLEGRTWKELDAISVSAGPGSYTGLRIAVSAAKGYAFALNIPIIAVNSLQALAVRSGKQSGLLIPMIDARRMEVYAAGFSESKLVFSTRAEVLTAQSFPEASAFQEVYFFGDGAEKAFEILAPLGFKFIADLRASAEGQALLAEEAFQARRFENIRSFEPVYLKDVVAGKKGG